MQVILSIKPEFAEKIFDGSKKFEFRRVIFKNPDIKSIIVYASSPVKKVIGEFEIDEILKDDLNCLWQQTQADSGITKDFFFEYFENKLEGFAIKIKSVTRYKEPKCLKQDYNLTPPQSFLYY